MSQTAKDASYTYKKMTKLIVQANEDDVSYDTMAHNEMYSLLELKLTLSEQRRIKISIYMYTDIFK